MTGFIRCGPQLFELPFRVNIIENKAKKKKEEEELNPKFIFPTPLDSCKALGTTSISTIYLFW